MTPQIHTELDRATAAPANGAVASDVVVELRGITKRFPGVLANDDVHLAVRRGEVHCLIGENGAGKSTLMSILAGMLRPDAGQILMDGRIVQIDSPQKALELGIGMVYQHTVLIPALTVLENLLLGESRGLRLETARALSRLQEFAGMLGVNVDPQAQVGKLALGQRQQVEIIKALWRGSRVLILDEPTSMLTPQGVADLQQVLVRLTGQGLAVIFITHKLREALAIGDRVSILRQGRVVGAIEPETLHALSHDELQARIVEIMFGEEARTVAQVAELQEEPAPARAPHALAQTPLLELVGLSAPGDGAGGGIQGISLALRPGEILGVAGVDGNGQRELAEAIAGQRAISAGELRFAGRVITRLGVRARQRLGIRYVTDDRLHEGIVPSMSVAMNLVLKRIGQPPFWRRGAIQQRVVNSTAQELVTRFNVRTPSIGARMGTLSGGNIQKVLLARDLSFEPRVVVYSKPTQGLDVKTARWVRLFIREQAEAGVTALLISTDLDELLQICDRIAVLYRGRLAGVVDNATGVGKQIGELMLGGSTG